MVRRPAFRTVRDYISGVLSHLGCGHLLRQLQETNCDGSSYLSLADLNPSPEGQLAGESALTEDTRQAGLAPPLSRGKHEARGLTGLAQSHLSLTDLGLEPGSPAPRTQASSPRPGSLRSLGDHSPGHLPLPLAGWATLPSTPWTL